MLKLLVPVDGSESSDRGVDHLIRSMQWYREPVEIHLLTVHHHIPYGRAASAVAGDKIQQYYQDEGLAALKSARARLDAAQIPYTFHIGLGEPAEIITRYAREKGCDQIIMGTRGLGSVGGLLLGSVATKVLHLASVPVLFVK
ncbi:MAG: universal stress protein [Betaproteobacteria bacterium]|jgi:nucleotide-binding universal stress UspA family protein|nr:universal stress protein [Betaproteobacteria bacterium]